MTQTKWIATLALTVGALSMTPAAFAGSCGAGGTADKGSCGSDTAKVATKACENKAPAAAEKPAAEPKAEQPSAAAK